MNDAFFPGEPPKRPPGNIHNLGQRVDRLARARGLGTDRIRQRVYSEVLIGLLNNAKAASIIPTYVLKGGMAMELRFGILARASKDLDIGIVAPLDDLIPVFDDALKVGFADFTFARKTIQRLDNAQAYRIGVQIAYKGRPFGTLSVDLNEASHEAETTVLTTGTLVALGLPGPVEANALGTYQQLSHKLHGATEPSRDDYHNMRYRDLIDILIFANSGEPLDFDRLRRTAIEEFARRQHHKVFPPNFTLPEDWRAALQEEAARINFATTDPDELTQQLVAFIARIEGSASPSNA